MTAAELLADLTDKGFVLAPEGNRIRIHPASRLSADLRRAIVASRAGLLALLGPEGPPIRATPAPVTPADLPADWRLLWEERAAIMEYDGGMPRDRADALALADVLQQMRAAVLEGKA